MKVEEHELAQLKVEEGFRLTLESIRIVEEDQHAWLKDES